VLGMFKVNKEVSLESGGSVGNDINEVARNQTISGHFEFYCKCTKQFFKRSNSFHISMT
jgi:hypothetical protein